MHNLYRQPFIKPLILLVGLYICMQPVVKGVHFLRVRHFWCPIHKVLRHASSTTQACPRRLTEFDQLEDVRLRLGPRPHYPCVMASSATQHKQELTRGVFVETDRSYSIVSRPGRMRRGQPASLLRYAPKQSPPPPSFVS